MDSTRLWIASATTATSGLRTASTSGNDRTAWNISRQRPKSDDAGRMAKAIDIFTTMCRYNTRHKNADDASVVTPFHSVAEPPVSLTVYMDRVDVQTNCGEEGVLLGMILIGRYHALTKVLPSVLSMHRLLLVATRLAVKAHHDAFRSNRTYARAGGLDLREVNDLELYLLSKLDYRVVVSHEQLKHFRNQLSLAATATTDAALAQHVACGIDPNAVPPQPNVLTTSSSVDATQTASGAAAVAVRTIRSTATNNNSNNTSTNGSALVSSSSRNTAAGASSSIRGASVMSPSDRRRGPASGSSANLLSPNTAAPDDGALLSDSVQSQRGSSTVVAASGKGRPPSVHHAVPPAPSASRNSGRPHS